MKKEDLARLERKIDAILEVQFVEREKSRLLSAYIGEPRPSKEYLKKWADAVVIDWKERLKNLNEGRLFPLQPDHGDNNQDAGHKPEENNQADTGKSPV